MCPCSSLIHVSVSSAWTVRIRMECGSRKVPINILAVSQCQERSLGQYYMQLQSQGRPRCDLTHWHSIYHSELHKEAPWPESASELYRPSDRRLSAKLVLTFLPIEGCRVVNVTDPYGRILGYLYRSRYFFFQIAPQMYSQCSVDPVPDPQLLGKCGSARDRTRTSGSVARNFGHWTTEAVYFLIHSIYKFSSYLTGNTIHLSSVARNSDH
jgi:hypothetical protein